MTFVGLRASEMPEYSASNSRPLPFERSQMALEQARSRFGPAIELFETQVIAQTCGLYSRHQTKAFLEQKNSLIARMHLDFDTQKALKYLAQVAVERQIRAIEPFVLKDWCKNQSAEPQNMNGQPLK